VTINEFHESVLGKVSSEHAGDLAWALDHVLPRVGSPYFTAKRLLDVIMSAALLVLLGPALLLIAFAIWVADREMPFYGQMRAGYLGRHFLLWKFRTMRSDAEADGPFLQFADRDPRVNRFGSVLRRLRIDELPQLWNVLRGDMSIVGPRPEWIREVEILEKAVPTYSLRYLVPPGLTGWAQVYFRKTNSPQDSIEKHNYDLYYLKHFSLALDISIMLKTMKRVVGSEVRDPAVVDPAPPSARTPSEIGVDIASIVGRG
jgi:lipopolysaccharide/colanic/teichoic acid biosynthesis glycosyltransferase